jgi:hypothetical protein
MRLTVASACRCWRILAAAAVALTRPSAVAAEWVLKNFDSIADYNMVGEYYGSYEGGPRCKYDGDINRCWAPWCSESSGGCCWVP